MLRCQAHSEGGLVIPYTSFGDITVQFDAQERARSQQSMDGEAELPKAPAFQAAPVPKTLYHPARLPAVPEAKPTEQRAFQLLSQARHQQVLHTALSGALTLHAPSSLCEGRYSIARARHLPLSRESDNPNSPWLTSWHSPLQL